MIQRFKIVERRLLAILVTGLALTVFSEVTFAENSVSGQPNIIFIMADDLGYGDLGCYGQKRIATPNIDQLSKTGMQFSDFYAGSTVCAPSRCVLMTGYHTGHCFIRGNGKESLRPQDCHRFRGLEKRRILDRYVREMGTRKCGFNWSACEAGL